MPRVAKPRLLTPALRALVWAVLLLPAVLLPVQADARAKAGPSRLHTVLDDSVLAVIQSDRPGESGREIGRARFARAWARLAPPARPDSLTPVGARRFLDLLLDQEALGLMAARERWTWTAQESAAFETLRDRLVVEVMLDSALTATRLALGAAGDSLDREDLGLASRERAMERLGPVFDDSLLARLALAFAALKRPTSDSSLSAQLRMLGADLQVDPADTSRVVAHSSIDDYRASDLLASWRRLSPVYRPHVTSAAQVRELVMNGLFERLLRREGEGRGLERRSDLAERLASQRELNDVSRLVEREVYARIAMDSLTLVRFYRATERDWMQPTRVRLVRVVLQNHSDAAAMALRLADAAAAESLAAGARRAGVEWTVDVSTAEDSALFARALRTGTGRVLGPDETTSGWAVARVTAVLPGRGRSFAEVRDRVEQRWSGEEGERLMRALVGRARAACHTRIHEDALDALLAQPPAGLGVKSRQRTSFRRAGRGRSRPRRTCGARGRMPGPARALYSLAAAGTQQHTIPPTTRAPRGKTGTELHAI